MPPRTFTDADVDMPALVFEAVDISRGEFGGLVVSCAAQPN